MFVAVIPDRMVLVRCRAVVSLLSLATVPLQQRKFTDNIVLHERRSFVRPQKPLRAFANRRALRAAHISEIIYVGAIKVVAG